LPHGPSYRASPRLYSQREYIVSLAARQRIAAIYEQREYAAAGGSSGGWRHDNRTLYRVFFTWEVVR
jgi:hypothetical protein